MFRRGLWRIFGHKTYQEVCDREWVISPATASIAPPALSLPGETEKITAWGINTNSAHEQLRINGGRREHAATIARALRNAHLFGDYVYKKSAKIQIGTQPERLLLYGHEAAELDSASLTCSWHDSKYFGHWMTDGIPLLMAGRELAPPIRNSNVLSDHQSQYLSMLEMNYEPFKAGKIRELLNILRFWAEQI